VILYLDSSALVKRYVDERGTAEVAAAVAGAELYATAEVSRAEISSALAKAIRTGALDADQAAAARANVHRDWAALSRVQLTEAVVANADDLAWGLGLRGYGAVQLDGVIPPPADTCSFRPEPVSGRTYTSRVPD
jgi:predicted nucleic acid-binding protein